MRIVVLGATGTIGKGVADLFRAKGHDVIAVSRSTEPALDMENPDSIPAFFEQIGEVDAIVSAAGNAAFAALQEISEDQIQLSLTSKLMGQVNLVRHGLTYLRPNGVAVITGGILAYAPWPKTSLVAMVNAGLEGFAKGAALDLTEGRRVLVVHPPLVAETAAQFGIDATPWPNAEKTAEAYLAAVEGSQNGEAVFVKGYAPADL